MPGMRRTQSTLGYKALWAALLLLHIVNVAYYLGAAVLYTQILHTNLGFQLSIYSIGISHGEWVKVSSVHIVVAACHGLYVLSMLGGSVYKHKLVFGPDTWESAQSVQRRLRRWCGSSRVSPSWSAESSASMSMSRLPQVSVNLVVSHGRAVLGRVAELGVEGVHFDSVHLVREVVETSLQTAQAYRMTTLLPRVWFIRFYVALLVANCWSTPFVYRYYRHSHRDRRLTSLLCDALLDVVSSIGVSLWLFASYAPQYTDPVFGFPLGNWFDDVWFTNMQQEFQMMMVVSWVDMIVRLVFAFGLLQCMGSIKKLLAHRAAEACSIATTDSVPVIPKAHAGPVLLDARSERKSVPSSSRWCSDLTSTWKARLPHGIHTAGPLVFIAWGAAILAVHIVSETSEAQIHIPCELKLHPWWTRKPACSLVVLDCYALGQLPGSIPSMASAWTTFDVDTTARVVVRHCPQLAVPTSLQEFHRLSVLKVYNSTIASWPSESALVQSAHPNMKAIFLIRTELPNGELPLGLLSAQFPRSLTSIVVSDSNLSILPPNLHEVWPQAMTLVFEATVVTIIQDTVPKLNPRVLSFAGSPVTVVPPEIFEMPALECLLLGDTRIQELPRTVSNPSRFWYLLSIPGTNISTFWSWMDPFVETSLYLQRDFFNAFDTPYCTRLKEITSTNGSGIVFSMPNATGTDLARVMDVATPENLRFAQRAVACRPGIQYYFALALEDSSSAIKDANR